MKKSNLLSTTVLAATMLVAATAPASAAFTTEQAMFWNNAQAGFNIITSNYSNILNDNFSTTQNPHLLQMAIYTVASSAGYLSVIPSCATANAACGVAISQASNIYNAISGATSIAQAEKMATQYLQAAATIGGVAPVFGSPAPAPVPVTVPTPAPAPNPAPVSPPVPVTVTVPTPASAPNTYNGKTVTDATWDLMPSSNNTNLIHNQFVSGTGNNITVDDASGHGTFNGISNVISGNNNVVKIDQIKGLYTGGGIPAGLPTELAQTITGDSNTVTSHVGQSTKTTLTINGNHNTTNLSGSSYNSNYPSSNTITSKISGNNNTNNMSVDNIGNQVSAWITGSTNEVDVNILQSLSGTVNSDKVNINVNGQNNTADVGIRGSNNTVGQAASPFTISGQYTKLAVDIMGDSNNITGGISNTGNGVMATIAINGSNNNDSLSITGTMDEAAIVQGIGGGYSNTVNTGVRNNYSIASITQNGSNNQAVITQQGLDGVQGYYATQTGSNNLATITENGNGNNASITQYGTGNRAILEVDNGNSFSITQTGNGLYANIQKTGATAVTSISQPVAGRSIGSPLTPAKVY